MFCGLFCWLVKATTRIGPSNYLGLAHKADPASAGMYVEVKTDVEIP